MPEETKKIKTFELPPKGQVVYQTETQNVKIIFNYDDFINVYKKLLSDALEYIRAEMAVEDDTAYSLTEQKLKEIINNCTNVWEYTFLIDSGKISLLDEAGKKFIDSFICEEESSQNSRSKEYKLSDGTTLLKTTWIS